MVRLAIQEQLLGVGAASGDVRVILSTVKWTKLLGDLAEKPIMGREGKDLLIKNSNLLKRLNILEGEIPFFVFITSCSDNLAKFRSATTDADCLSAVACGFAKGICDALSQQGAKPSIFRTLWGKLTGNQMEGKPQ